MEERIFESVFVELRVQNNKLLVGVVHLSRGGMSERIHSDFLAMCHNIAINEDFNWDLFQPGEASYVRATCARNGLCMVSHHVLFSLSRSVNIIRLGHENISKHISNWLHFQFALQTSTLHGTCNIWYYVVKLISMTKNYDVRLACLEVEEEDFFGSRR